jgi:translation elongation factor EF-Ts
LGFFFVVVKKMASFKKFSKTAVVGLLSTIVPSCGYVIDFRSETDFVDAVDSYPALVVNFYDSSSEQSRQSLSLFHSASKILVPEIQLASVDVSLEDFQNIAETFDSSQPVQMYVHKEKLSTKLLTPMNQDIGDVKISPEDFRDVVKATARKAGIHTQTLVFMFSIYGNYY